MVLVVKLAVAVISALPMVLANPFFWLAVFLVGIQTKKIIAIREQIYDAPQPSVFNEVAGSLLWGVLGGFIGSILFIAIGISVNHIGIEYIWPAAIGLMLINQRFMCFSYAGGLLSLTSLLFGWPDMEVSEVICLVAILHIVEAILIRLSGHIGAIPIFMRNKQGRLYGGFTLQRFWPVPVMVLAVLGTVVSKSMDGIYNMPGWWPLVKPDDLAGVGKAGWMFGIMPVTAALGYGGIALTCSARAKTIKTSRCLAIYSTILLVVAVISDRLRILQYLAAVFSFLGHEAVIWYGRLSETRGAPLFVNPLKGLRVLAVAHGSAADKLGIISGDIIRKANGRDIFTEDDLKRVLSDSPFYLEIEVERATKNGTKTHVFKKNRGVIDSLGTVIVPKDYDWPLQETLSRSLLQKLWHWRDGVGR